MASTEFAQFRLQQVRSVENQQVLERLNVSLKKQIEELKAANSGPPPENYKPKLALLCRNVKDWLGKMRLEMDQTKSLCSMQATQITFLNKTIQDTVQLMAAHANDHDSDSKRFAAENAALARELKAVQQELRESQRGKASLQDTVSRLQGELDQSVHEKELLTQDCALLRGQIETLTDHSKGLEGNLASAQDEIARLKQKVRKLEEFGGEALQAALDAQRIAAAENERLVAELRARNEEQELTITNLRLHIERLTAALNGNKSHFAKFVELKTENAVLHTQLNHATGAPVSNLHVQQANHFHQQQQQQAEQQQGKQSLQTPNMPRGALAAVDPSLMDYHDSINNYINTVNAGAKPPGGKSKPPVGLKPYGKKESKSAPTVNSARQEPGIPLGGRSSPRSSVDDNHVHASSGNNQGGMFPRVTGISQSNQNTRKPSPGGRNGNSSNPAVPGLNFSDISTTNKGSKFYFSDDSTPDLMPESSQAQPSAPSRKANVSQKKRNSRGNSAMV